MATPSVRSTPAYRGTARPTAASRESVVPGTPATQRTSTTAASRATTNQLPEYEPPTFSLTPAAQRQIGDLIRASNLTKLSYHLDEAQSAVANAAADINDRLTQGRKESAKRKRSEVEGEDGTVNGDGEVERILEELQDKVERMTKRMDESMRKMIDGKQGVAQIKESLARTSEDARANATQAATQPTRSQRQRRTRQGDAGPGSDEDEEEDEVQPFTPTDPANGTQVVIAPIDVFKQQLEDAKTRYQSTSLFSRYAGHDDYVKFKALVHDAQHPEDDNSDTPVVPLPPARTWFEDEDGGVEPAPGVTGGAGGDDSDDDIAISRATISIRCPLTLQTYRDPLSSKLCSHTFEASAIKQLLQTSETRGSVQCPCQGCKQTLTAKDLHQDPVLLRKIKRIQRAKELEEEDAMEGGVPQGTARNATLIEDDGEGEEVDSLLERTQMGTQRMVKGESKGSAAVGVHGSGIGGVNASAPARGTQVMELGESSSEEEAEEEEEEGDEMEE